MSAASGEVYSRTVTVADAAGLHARPASKVAEMAAQAEGDIVISFDGEEAEADSAMMLMSLGASHGASITVKLPPLRVSGCADESVVTSTVPGLM